MKKLLVLAVLLLSLFPAQAKEKLKLESKVYLDFMYGVAHDLAGEPEAALKYFEAALKEAPDSQAIKTQILIAALGSGKQKEYAELAKEVSTFNDAEAVAAYAQYCWAQGNLSEAMQYYERAISLAPENAPLKVEYMALLKSVDPKLAIAFLEKYAKDFPAAAAAAQHEIALLKLSQNDINGARISLNEATRLDPYLAQPYLVRAEIDKRTSNFSSAQKEYKALEKLGYSSAALYNNMGTVAVLLSDIKGAKAYFEKALELEPGNPTACKFMATIAEDEGRFEESKKYLMSSLTFNENAQAQLEAAFYASKAGQPQDAAKLLAMAYKTSEGSVEIGYFYAVSLQDLGQHKAAVAIYKEMLEKAPEFDKARLRCAMSLFELKDYKEIEKQMRAVLEREPDNTDALNSLGYAMLMRNYRIDEAARHIKRALELEPDAAPYIDSLGWYYYIKKDYPRALDLLSAAYDKLPHDREVSAHLGMVYYQMKDWANAVKFLEISQDAQYAKYLKKANKQLERGQ